MTDRDVKTGRFPPGRGAPASGKGGGPAKGAGWGGPANGAGWGGPANGAGLKAVGPGRRPGVKNGEGKAAQARAALEAAAPLAVQTVIDLAQNQADPRALQAALAVLNRVGLHEKAGIEHSGEGGGPVVIVTGVPRGD